MLENPWYLLLLLPAAGAGLYAVLARPTRAAVRVSSTGLFDNIPSTLRARASRLLWVLRVAALLLIAMAAAGPRRGIETVIDTTKGVDIALCVDVSGSMRESDLARGMTRLEVARNVAAEFMDARPYDRIALIPFAKYAYRLSPLTLHHDWVKQQLARIRIKDSRRPDPHGRDAGLVDETRTAIGDAIGVAAEALRRSKAKSRLVILLTDGRSNFGKLRPLEAAEIARRFDVRIYTIGAGRVIERRVFGVRVGMHDPIDEDTLRRIARKTGGRYFRAQDAEALARVYGEIDAMEKTEVTSLRFTRYRERFGALALPALVLLLIEAASAWVLLRRAP